MDSRERPAPNSTRRSENVNVDIRLETNGLRFSEPSDDPRQPHIVQVGAIADVERFEVVSSIDMTRAADRLDNPG